MRDQARKLRDDMKPKCKMIIEDDDSNFLWFDHWHPYGPLIEKYGKRVVYDFGLALNVEVKEVITSNQ